LQLQGGITVNNERLDLSGSGFQLQNNGALRNISGNNTWHGPVNLTELRGFSPASYYGSNGVGIVSIGVDNTGDTLTIDGTINDLPASPVPASPPVPLTS